EPVGGRRTGPVDPVGRVGKAHRSLAGALPALFARRVRHDLAPIMDRKLTAPCAVLLLACAPAVAPVESPTSPAAAGAAVRPLGEPIVGAGTALPPAAVEWVERTLAGLSLRQKVAQLVMPWVGADYTALDSPEFERVRRWVEEDGVGGLVLSVGMPHSYAAKLNALQRLAAVPLLVASDMENGPGMRMAGIYSLPHLLPQGGGTAF